MGTTRRVKGKITNPGVITQILFNEPAGAQKQLDAGYDYYYDTVIRGTVTVVAGTGMAPGEFVGTGTFFTEDLAVGSIIVVGDETHVVAAIADNTNLTLVADHTAGATAVPVTKQFSGYIGSPTTSRKIQVENRQVCFVNSSTTTAYYVTFGNDPTFLDALTMNNANSMIILPSERIYLPSGSYTYVRVSNAAVSVYVSNDSDVIELSSTTFDRSKVLPTIQGQTPPSSIP